MDDLEPRIRNLEAWKHQMDTATAVEEVRRKHMDQRFDRVDKEISDIKGGMTKVLWAVGLLVLTGVVNFILNGGLNVGP